MSLLLAHLEQISLSCEGIDSLPFPPPKIFTNALLSKPDITSLIRDTEAHERALFSVPPPLPAATSANPDPPKPSSRRQTVFNVAAGEVTTGPSPNISAASRSGFQSTTRRNTAVAAVLGGDLHAQITRRRGEGEVDIEVLLRGAEKLCGVYALPGALERIPQLRQKWEMQSHTLEYYEAKIAEQMERMNLEKSQWEEEEDVEEEEEGIGGDYATEEDLRREEEEARVLDRKKRELQARLRALESDLVGLT